MFFNYKINGTYKHCNSEPLHYIAKQFVYQKRFAYVNIKKGSYKRQLAVGLMLLRCCK